MSQRHDHGRNYIGKVGIELCAKSFILQVYDVLARHNSEATITLLSVADNSTLNLAVKGWSKLHSLDWTANGQGLFVSALAKEDPRWYIST
jgi:hypothetical protein